MSRNQELGIVKHIFALMIGSLLISLPAVAQDSAFVRQFQFELARAKDFHRHELAAEHYEEQREAHVDQYKEKVARQEHAEEIARESYVDARNRRAKGLSDEELDEILHKKVEREAAQYEAERESFVHLRNQIEAAHNQAPLNENEEYSL